MNFFLFPLFAQKLKQRKRVTGYVQLDFPNMLSSMRVSRSFSSLCGSESALGPCQESLQSANSTFDWVMAMAGCFTKPQLLESYQCIKKSKILTLVAMGSLKKQKKQEGHSLCKPQRLTKTATKYLETWVNFLKTFWTVPEIRLKH